MFLEKAGLCNSRLQMDPAADCPFHIYFLISFSPSVFVCVQFFACVIESPENATVHSKNPAPAAVVRKEG